MISWMLFYCLSAKKPSKDEKLFVDEHPADFGIIDTVNYARRRILVSLT
jgi:hypothetical protein